MRIWLGGIESSARQYTARDPARARRPCSGPPSRSAPLDERDELVGHEVAAAADAQDEVGVGVAREHPGARQTDAVGPDVGVVPLADQDADRDGDGLPVRA